MRISTWLFVVMTLVLPYATHAQSVQDLQQQVRDLLARVTQLQQQIGTGGSTAPLSSSGSGQSVSSACPLLGVSLKFGSTGDDVSRLQRFLATDSSVYPEGTVSGYFGARTEAAVQRWQVKNNIVSSGTPGTTGFGVVGPRTAAAMSLACATLNGSGGTQASIGPSPVGGFIQVTPITGNAPLAVAIQATVNTTNSCSGATYSLDYGDGSQPSLLTVPSGSCYPINQTLGHTYQYGGTYKVTLSSGEHTTTATVTVTGPAAPVSGGVGVGNPAIARGTISAFVTSGPAPLTTTFYISCGAGVAYNVVFGDGQELGSSGVSSSSCTGSLQSVSHTYMSPGGYTAQLVIFIQQSNGTIIPVTIASVSISAAGGSSDGSGLGSMSLAPNVGGDPLQVQAHFDTGNCQTYSLEWGDGQVAGATPACTGSNSTLSLDHRYQAVGSYTIRLTRGSRVDTLSVTITN